MPNPFTPSGNLEFIGSKERLQRTVTRSGGSLLCGNQVQLTLVTRASRPNGYSFKATGLYRQTSQGFQIDYRIMPTAVTVLRYLLVILILTAISIAELIASDTPKLTPFIIIVLPLLLFGYHSHCKDCEKAFRKLFGAATYSRKNR